ncbi:MAG TPA: tetratricopeptide repeat protein [Candidatus Obscuribacterales bacterium]
MHNTLRYTILHNLALCNAALGDYTKARALLKAVMDDEQKYLGPSSIFLAWTLCSLAKVDLEEGTPDAVKAINSTYDRVIELLETANLDETSPETCQAMMGISNFFLKIGRYSDAEQLLHQLLTINEKRPDSPVVAHARELLGRCYLEEGKIKEARVELNQVLKILEAIHKNTFLTLPQTASIWNELGRSYVLEANEAKNSAQRTRLALEAVRLLRKALELQTRSVGQQHRDIIYTTRNLAQAYELAGNHAQAMHYLKQALTVGESIAPDHPVHAETLALSANLYLNRGDYDKAENEAVEALRILSRNISVNSRTINEVLVLLGIIELKHGIPESQVRRHILLLFKQKLGEDNPITAYWRKVCSTPTPAKGPKQKATPHISR